jgi:hypothetical protein
LIDDGQHFDFKPITHLRELAMNQTVHQAENRAFKRVQFFTLPNDEQISPDWADFNAESTNKILVGLVVDLSLSGIQVLTKILEVPRNQSYQLSFLADDRKETPPVARVKLKYVWSEPIGNTYTRTGFTFLENAADTVNALIDGVQARSQTYLRCALEPLPAVN